VYAAILAVFYRGRPLSQHLTFALHLHTAVFVVLTLRELANFTGQLVIAAVAGASAMLVNAAYAILALKTVYGQSWPRTLLTGVGIALIYLVAGLGAIVAAIAWAAR
jgi:hypothetical protein